ncbi:unnamed protein product [Nesidiocoris tenuis]|uniref:Uncharacterized protein n=1 Tax=Nesidiocoris tenuis TaxID=355587 RepID=A0A6H5H363_9HEMI|nr:unnamed protein product [Nesidiocoris tenuis]
MNELLTTVPVFNGDITRFAEFRRLFDRAVHNLDNVPDEIKYEKLLSKLSPETRSSFVASVQDGSNYRQLYDALCAENTAKYRLARSAFAKRSQIPKLSGQSVQELDRFVNEARLWANMMSDLPTENLAEFLLFEALFHRLSPDLREKFNRDEMESADGIPSHNQLLAFVEKELKIARMLPADSSTSRGSRSISSSRTPLAKPRSPSPYKSAGNAPPVTVPQYSCLKTSRFGLTPTAVVTVSSCGGKSVGQFRALVDSGAQTNLITYDLAQTLGLRLLPENVILSGVGDRKTLVRYRAIAILHTRSDKRIPFTASVIDQVGAPLPNRDWDSAYWPHVLPVKSRLADPDFSTSRGTDLLLGVDIMSKVLLGPAGPDLWDTDLGLLVVGQLPPRPKKSVRIHPYDHVHPFYQDSPTTVIQPHPSLVKERSSAAAYSASVTPHVFSSPPFLVENYHKIALKEIVEIIRQGYGNPKSCRTSSPCPLLESQPPLPEESQSPSKPKLLSIKDVPVSPSIVRNLFSVVPPVSTDECNLKLFNISDTARTADMQLVQPSIIHFSSAVSSAPTSVMAKTSTIVIEDLLRQMFEIESVEPVRPWTPEEEKAEQLFLNSVHRDDCGRYVVSLPFSEPPESLGESRHIALRQLYRLEARLKRNPVLAKAYQEFMAEYLELGHMRRLEPLDVKHSPNYYIPHHAVHREGDPPERIRVVFNASQRTSNGRSLNEILLVGPKLQSEISCMITRFRSFRYVFISDIRQMFRQIRHPESDHDMLRIVWRNSSDEPIQDFALCTVTYGTTSAPFLANRVVQHLAEEGSVSHPTASRILREHTYVDDVHGGGEFFGGGAPGPY